MTKLQPVRGTHDILPEEAARRRALTAVMERVCSRYGYGEIIPPIFEFSEVFHRTLGESSDIVGKETYSFTDRGGENITLRPEFTASVVRAFLSNSLQDQTPFKVYYLGPAFRYERPQKGRLRQFTQFGAELLGDAGPLADAEMIAMAAHCLEALGLKPQARLELNSLGDAESRKAYRAALVEYFHDHVHNLSPDSKIRLEKNPLRILDSKDEGDRKLVAAAPDAKDYFTATAQEFFAGVQAALSALKIEYALNPRLVRGLDYYSHTVFEFTTEALGAQGTVLAGGRYDGLVKLMGGPDIPGIGFAAGVERLLALMEAAGSAPPLARTKVIAVIPVDSGQEMEALKLAQELRLCKHEFSVELITRGNMGKKMKRADKLGAAYALMLGEEEIASGQVTVKTLADGSQRQVARAQLESCIA